jgi:hypothetical protein
MRPISTFCTLFLLFCVFYGGSVLIAQDGGTGSGAAAEEEDWLEFYYKHPTPDRFVSELKSWAQDGTLDNEQAKPALIAFISQVIRQNPDRLNGWYADLSGLTPEQMQIVHTGMLFSRTKEADEIIRSCDPAHCHLFRL